MIFIFNSTLNSIVKAFRMKNIGPQKRLLQFKRFSILPEYNPVLHWVTFDQTLFYENPSTVASLPWPKNKFEV